MAIPVLIVAFAVAAVLCASLIPWFRRAFLVNPGARSSHRIATPQGGGLVVVPVALAVAFVAQIRAGSAGADPFPWSLTGAMVLLMLLGGWDDRASLNPVFRLLVQAGAVALALTGAPHDPPAPLTILPTVVVWACLLIGMLWFINLTNFMDGVDLMSVTQFVPACVTVYLLLAGLAGPAQWVGVVCLAVAGALLGFALLNKPPARLFLGDSGSLPLGVLGATAALVVAASRGPAVALLPFLYYFADATLTLARRILAGEKVWQAHRQHFYQRAMSRGLSIWRIIGRVAACNILLCAAALLIAGRPLGAQLAGLAFGVVVVALLMGDLVRERA